MPKYIIERNVPGAGKLNQGDLAAMSAKSNAVVSEVGHDLQWVESYVVADKIVCVYIAKNADLIREHSRCSGFPADAIHQVSAVIDPTTGEHA